MTYTDNVAVAVSWIGTGDVVVSGPNSYSEIATFLNVNPSADGTPLVADYEIPAPGGSWDFTDIGTYTVSMAADEVEDTSGKPVAAGAIGTFTVDVSDVDLYGASFTFEKDGGNLIVNVDGTEYVYDASLVSPVNLYGSGDGSMAYLYDTAGSETYTGGLGTSEMQNTTPGSEFHVLATGFKKVVAYATDGNDQATINDGPGNDRFYGTPDMSYMWYADGSYSRAKGFDSVSSTSTGGVDTAYLYDSALDDLFEADDDWDRCPIWTLALLSGSPVMIPS